MTDLALLEMLEREQHEQDEQFLKSWKVAVKMIGPHLFTVTAASVEAANHRNELRPDVEAINHYVQSTTYDHHYFLFMVISFFSFTTIEDIFMRAGIGFPRIIDLQLLDETERMIVYALIEASDVDGWE